MKDKTRVDLQGGKVEPLSPSSRVGRFGENEGGEGGVVDLKKNGSRERSGAE
jgi:hypothetical protein